MIPAGKSWRNLIYAGNAAETRRNLKGCLVMQPGAGAHNVMEG